MRLRQRTIRRGARLQGVGLHSGQSIQLDIYPASGGHGITFTRTDALPHEEVRAVPSNIVDTTLATSLGAGVNGSRVRVGTVEHLMAALYGLGIDNARVHLDGPEVPVLDGSAQPFVAELKSCGIEEQHLPKSLLVITREVRIDDGDRVASIRPGPGLEIECSIDFGHPLISPAPFHFDFSERAFCRDVAPARTFGFLRDVEALRERGFALGGSLENAIVIDDYRIVNPEGMRFADELVRHKVLDAVGDLALLGMPVIGRLELRRPGHTLNTRLIEAILADEDCYRIVSPDAVTSEGRPALPLYEPADGFA